MKFNTRLRQLRRQNNLTQKDLADILGVKATAISNYESNRNEPSFDKLLILSEYFEVSCDYLLGVTDLDMTDIDDKLDKDIVEVFDIYHQLNKDHASKLKIFAEYLLYRQNLSI